jgi:putative methylase
MALSKTGLAIVLSKLKVFGRPNIHLEQYPTDSEIAADILWNAYLQGDIEGKVIADLGSGTGILGIGALLLGASRVFFVETDAEASDIAKNNLHIVQSEYSMAGKATFLNEDIQKFTNTVDSVLQNPPFGVKNAHADRIFLLKAFAISKIAYSIHKSESTKFIQQLSDDNSMIITHRWDYSFPLKQSYSFHDKRIHRIKVSAFRLERKSI